MLALKRQKIKPPRNGRIGSCTYDDVTKPLPTPPDGQMWAKEELNWKLIPCSTAEPATAHVMATSIHAPGSEAYANREEVAEAVPVDLNSPQKKNAAPSNNTALYHEVRPTDTFPGICLRYKVTPTELRRANHLLSNNLSLIDKLVIPLITQKKEAVDQVPSKEKLAVTLVTRVSGVAQLTYTEARAYLELSDWDMDGAVSHVREDFVEPEVAPQVARAFGRAPFEISHEKKFV